MQFLLKNRLDKKHHSVYPPKIIHKYVLRLKSLIQVSEYLPFLVVAVIDEWRAKCLVHYDIYILPRVSYLRWTIIEFVTDFILEEYSHIY